MADTIQIMAGERRTVTITIRDTSANERLIRPFRCSSINFYMKNSLDQSVAILYDAYLEEEASEGYRITSGTLTAGNVTSQKRIDEISPHPYINVTATAAGVSTSGTLLFDIYGVE